MKEAVLYARVSSDRQEREGFSIPAQLELLRAYAHQKGFTIVQEYTEAETAKKAGRDRFSEMVSFLKKRKKPAAVLVEKTDRLLRNLDDYVLVSHIIRDHNAEVHKVKENMVISRESKSFELFIDGLNALLAKRYTDNLSEEVSKGRRQKVMSGGWHTLAPYGYKNDKNTRQIIIDPEEAPFVIRAFQIYATGIYSLEKTIDMLDLEGFRYRPAARRINLPRLHKMLQNPAYIGKIPFQGDIYPGNHTPLIDADTWRQVQLAFRKDNKPVSMAKRDFLYRGLITCGDCGSAIVGELKKEKYIYYRCSGKQKKGCQQGYVTESVITDEVAGIFASLKFPSDAKERIIEAVRIQHGEIYEIGNRERSRLEGLLKKAHQKRRVIYEDKLAGVIDLEMYQQIDQDTLGEIERLEAQKSKITHADTDFREEAALWVELPEMLTGRWIRANMEEKKRILNFLVSNFSLRDGKPDIDLHPVFHALRVSNEILKSREWQEVVRTVIFPLFSLHSETVRNIYKALAA